MPYYDFVYSQLPLPGTPPGPEMDPQNGKALEQAVANLCGCFGNGALVCRQEPCQAGFIADITVRTRSQRRAYVIECTYQDSGGSTADKVLDKFDKLQDAEFPNRLLVYYGHGNKGWPVLKRKIARSRHKYPLVMPLNYEVFELYCKSGEYSATLDKLEEE